jgi:hypothetical protein
MWYRRLHAEKFVRTPEKHCDHPEVTRGHPRRRRGVVGFCRQAAEPALVQAEVIQNTHISITKKEESSHEDQADERQDSGS